MKNIDLRVLAIVSELNRTRSVSQTAEALGLSQSAVSMSLAKLRKHFNDPLFVRTSSGMEPTPHASDVITMLRQAEGLLQTALGHHVVFDPRTSDRRFTIHSTDIALITFIPELMDALGKLAPGVRVDLRRITEESPKQLESGEADLAIGFMVPLGAGYCQQRLFKERLVCVVRQGHPRVRDTFGLDEFLKESHVAIATNGTGHAILEKTLSGKRLNRKIGLTIPSFLGVSHLLASLDYVATVPERLALHLAPSVPIKVFPLPIPVAPYLIVQQWHERYTHDPASRWLRALIVKMFASTKPLPATAKPGTRPGSKGTAAAVAPISGIDKIHQRTIIDFRQRPS